MTAERMFALLLLVFVLGVVIGDHGRAAYDRKHRARSRRVIHDSRRAS